jgi:RimJ/RimL family protein N-acetyltransferase
MHLRSELNEFGDPVGLPMEQRERPTLPDEAFVLEGRYCYLEALDADKHARDLFEAYSLDTDGRLWTYIPNGPWHTFEDLAAHVRNIEHKADPFFYAIIDTNTKKAVGIASYLRIDPTSQSIEVGWITYSTLMQRTPIATECMYLMMRNAFDMGYRRYEWKCNSMNRPSISAAMRLGMTFEGLFRQHTMAKGHNRDTAWFAIIDKDWDVARNAFETWLNPDNFDSDGIQKQRLSDLTAPIVYDRWPTLTVTTDH